MHKIFMLHIGLSDLQCVQIMHFVLLLYGILVCVLFCLCFVYKFMFFRIYIKLKISSNFHPLWDQYTDSIVPLAYVTVWCCACYFVRFDLSARFDLYI